MAPLHVEVSGDGPTLVLAHGFTQTGRLWGRFGDRVGAGRRVVAVDLPGHGGSADVRADLDEGGRLLVEAAGVAPFDLVGYSLGARFALHAALGAPGAVGRLVLLSATAGIEAEGERAQRRRRDDELAERLEGGQSVGSFLAGWLANPMFATLRSASAGTEERERNTPVGLASSLRLAGAGVQAPLWDRLGELRMPVLVIAGATDPRYQVLGQRLAAAVGAGSFCVIPGAGHAVHLEQPELCARAVGAFLEATADPD